MKIPFLLFTLAAATAAHAADVVLTPQPLATKASAKPAQQMARMSPPPTISETSVTRRPDGSLTMNCVQKPNPRLRAARAAQQAAAQQP